MRAKAVLASLPALITQRLKDEMYVTYVTDSLMYTVNNIQRLAGGVSIGKRYHDIVSGIDKPRDTRTGEEIAADVIKRAGLEVVGIDEPI